MAKFLCLKDALKVVARDRCRRGTLNTRSRSPPRLRDAVFSQADCILNDVKPFIHYKVSGPHFVIRYTLGSTSRVIESSFW